MTRPTETRSTCPYCGVGCGVIIESTGAQITGVRGDPDHPANYGRLCTKGSTLHHTATAAVTLQTRLLHPMQRLQRGQAPKRVSWDHALGVATHKFAQVVRDHGPDAVGFYVSGQLLTEDYYVFNKLAKGLIGTNNIDTNSRLCMSSAVAGYKTTLGADAPPACNDDVNHVDCIFIVGSNTAWAHPVLFRRIEDSKRANPAMKVILVDPRRTDTAEIADLHLPIQPGTDVMLFNGMLHLMLWEGWTNAAYIAHHTNDFETLKATVRDCTPELVAQICGISKDALLQAARWFATSKATLSLYCMGLNQSSSGTAKNAALINLHLATAQIGKPGAGPFSLTGQPNAMGGREVGGMANLLSGHRDLANAAHRAEVAALWGIADVPSKPGKTAIEVFQAAADGEIKALWIACTNPAQSMPDQATVRRALERAELVIVQEAFATTVTCEYADLLLAATTWGEKTGTVTNSERRISRVRPAVAAPGEARHDWSIAVEFAQLLESELAQPPHTVQLRHARIHLERAPRIHAGPRPRHYRHGLRHAGRRRPAMAAAHGRNHRPGTLVRKRHFPHCGRQGPVRQHRLPAGGRATRSPLPVLVDHRSPARPMARHEPYRHAGPPVWPRSRTQHPDAPPRHGAPPAHRRRPGPREQQARLHRGASGHQQRSGHGPHLHRHALE